MHVVWHPQDGLYYFHVQSNHNHMGKEITSMTLSRHIFQMTPFSSTLSWRVRWRYSYIGSFWSYPLFVCSISHCVTSYVFLYYMTLYRTHGFSKHTSLESDASSLSRYLCHDLCCVCVAKSNYHCCSLFKRIKYGHTSVLKIWDRLYVMVYMYMACTYLYMLYIFHKQIWWTWEGKSVETYLWKMVH